MTFIKSQNLNIPITMTKLAISGGINIECIIPHYKFGFNVEHDTIKQVHRIINTIETFLEKSLMISYSWRLIKRLIKLGMSLLYKRLISSLFKIFASYLSERLFSV